MPKYTFSSTSSTGPEPRRRVTMSVEISNGAMRRWQALAPSVEYVKEVLVAENGLAVSQNTTLPPAATRENNRSTASHTGDKAMSVAQKVVTGVAQEDQLMSARDATTQAFDPDVAETNQQVVYTALNAPLQADTHEQGLAP